MYINLKESSIRNTNHFYNQITTNNKMQVRKATRIRRLKKALKKLRFLYITNSRYYCGDIDLNTLLTIHAQAKTWYSTNGFYMAPAPYVGQDRWIYSSIKQSNNKIGKLFSNWFDPIEVKEFFGSAHLRKHKVNIIRIRNINPHGDKTRWISFNTTINFCNILQCRCCKTSVAA